MYKCSKSEFTVQLVYIVADLHQTTILLKKNKNQDKLLLLSFALTKGLLRILFDSKQMYEKRKNDNLPEMWSKNSARFAKTCT